ncbi:hypothetical protein EVAR_95672_1 [Eumeta japonica]|uniref:Uncharacterized protein n=1 Tax=Eumeta variegata TaxID=151549 RepID=A0A4C1VKJ1_EUMVA|nr:hypothetical protein EVAR_95672_1 [Eumeta japonica]
MTLQFLKTSPSTSFYSARSTATCNQSLARPAAISSANDVARLLSLRRAYSVGYIRFFDSPADFSAFDSISRRNAEHGSIPSPNASEHVYDGPHTKIEKSPLPRQKGGRRARPHAHADSEIRLDPSEQTKSKLLV